jgi:RNA polymerase sigma-70 factor (ECF subfamily)
MTPVPNDISLKQSASPLFNEAALAQLRENLLRFATLQLRNSEVAEDVVQDTILAALAASDRFDHRASVKTWVFSILKNKIVDVFRDRWNKNRVELAEATGDEADFDVLFMENDRWQRSEMPSRWGDPEQTFSDKQFWKVFELCTSKMPEATVRVFFMRELLGLEVSDICKELGITTSNCWVILHRARMSLRLCLQQRWFERDEKT